VIVDRIEQEYRQAMRRAASRVKEPVASGFLGVAESRDSELE
jgi:hypothetical protein